jgi:hypothetical protein
MDSPYLSISLRILFLYSLSSLLNIIYSRLKNRMDIESKTWDQLLRKDMWIKRNQHHTKVPNLLINAKNWLIMGYLSHSKTRILIQIQVSRSK